MKKFKKFLSAGVLLGITLFLPKTFAMKTGYKDGSQPKLSPIQNCDSKFNPNKSSLIRIKSAPEISGGVYAVSEDDYERISLLPSTDLMFRYHEKFLLPEKQDEKEMEKIDSEYQAFVKSLTDFETFVDEIAPDNRPIKFGPSDQELKEKFTYLKNTAKLHLANLDNLVSVYFSGEDFDYPESIMIYNLELLANFEGRLKSIDSIFERHTNFIEGYINNQMHNLKISEAVDSEGKNMFAALNNYLENIFEFYQITFSIEKGKLPVKRELYIDEYNRLNLSRKSSEEISSKLKDLIIEHYSSRENVPPHVLKFLSDIEWEIDCLKNLHKQCLYTFLKFTEQPKEQK